MAAVLLACASALLFGGMSVALAFAFREDDDADVGSLLTVTAAFGVCAGAAVVDRWDRGNSDASSLLPFFLVGFLSPGVAQLMFTRAVREAGASRTSVAVGVAPLVAVVIALIFLGEPVNAGLIAGALLVVLGSVALVRERVRPESFRWLGIGYAVTGTVLFATRDNIVRWLAQDTHAAPLAAAATSLLAGVLAALAVLAVTRRAAIVAAVRRSSPRFLVAGVLFGLSYVFLFEAYYRGRVTVVSPLVATESLWGVLLSALLLGRTELVSRRLVLGALLIVAGGALIGAAR
ncbi:MAG: DMT family transporter [Actinomycetota bacterium]|nr:DMT family transporter [Actinomycetota bacterium]